MNSFPQMLPEFKGQGQPGFPQQYLPQNMRFYIERPAPQRSVGHPVNEDLVLYESLEWLQGPAALKISHVCGVCHKYVPAFMLRECYGLLSKRVQRVFLVHQICFKSSIASTSLPKVNSSLAYCEICPVRRIEKLTLFNSSNFVKSHKRNLYSLILDFFQPCTTGLVYRVEKILPVLEECNQGFSLLYLNFQNMTSSSGLLANSNILLPFGEFRCNLTFIPSASQTKSLSFSFYFNLGPPNIEARNCYHQVFYNKNGTTFTLEIEEMTGPEDLVEKMTNFKLDPGSFLRNDHTLAYSLKSLLVNLPIFPSCSQSPVTGIPAALAQPDVPSNRWIQEMHQGSTVSAPGELGGSPRSHRKAGGLKLVMASDSSKSIDSRLLNFGDISSKKIQLEELSDRSEENFQDEEEKSKVYSGAVSTSTIPHSEPIGLGSPDEGELLNEMVTYELIKGRVFSLGTNNHGSRKIQRFLQRATEKEINCVLEEIESQLHQLMCDTYGNFMFQTLVECCSSAQRIRIIEAIQSQILPIACNPRGTHALQRLTGLISQSIEENKVKSVLKGNIVELSLNQHGTHFLQKVITCFEDSNVEFAVDEILSEILKVAVHCHGICVVKDLMEKFVNKNKEVYCKLINAIGGKVEILSQNSYGNYVIQHALILDENAPGMDVIYNSLLRRTIQLSIHKFSSNIIEKCLQLKTAEIRQKFTETIFHKGNLSELIKNKFGNFVLMRALNQEMSSEARANILSTINSVLSNKNMEKYRAKWMEFMMSNYQHKMPYYGQSAFSGMEAVSDTSKLYPSSFSTGFPESLTPSTEVGAEPFGFLVSPEKRGNLPQSNQSIPIHMREKKGSLENEGLHVNSDRGSETFKKPTHPPSMLSKLRRGKKYS